MAARHPDATASSSKAGVFYPDPRNDWMYQLQSHENGFDGSEAENALHHTLDHVEPRQRTHGYPKGDVEPQPVQPSDSDYETPTHKGTTGAKPGNGGTVYSNGRGVLSNNGKTMPAIPDQANTQPTVPPAAPGVPVPYPTTSMGSTTTKGAATTPVIDTRPVSVDVDPCNGQQLCGNAMTYGPANSTVYKTPNTLGTRRAAPTLNIPSNGANTGGTMTQVAPPPLVINSQGQMISPNPYIQQGQAPAATPPSDN